jgi:hypothetical protein
MPKPRPARAPKALAKLDVTGQDVAKDTVASDVAAADQPAAERAEPAASADMQLAKLDPQAVPLPQPKPDEVDETPEREAKHGRRAVRHRHFRYARAKKPETPALIALFQKLTTPAQPTTRRRR